MAWRWTSCPISERRISPRLMFIAIASRARWGGCACGVACWRLVRAPPARAPRPGLSHLGSFAARCPVMSRVIHVVGAGVAGLSAAVCLTSAAAEVVLHEASGQAGGRCRSYYDPTIDAMID